MRFGDSLAMAMIDTLAACIQKARFVLDCKMWQRSVNHSVNISVNLSLLSNPAGFESFDLHDCPVMCYMREKFSNKLSLLIAQRPVYRITDENPWLLIDHSQDDYLAEMMKNLTEKATVT